MTYDIEFHGPNPLTGVLALGTLRAAEEMALALEEREAASQYRQKYEQSMARLQELTWNGEYFEQDRADENQQKYQHGQGCLSDQLFGQQLAHLYGLGHLLPADRVKSAIQAVYRHNYRENLSRHVNCQRVYALHDEQGLLLCSWPRGGRPVLPFIYSDEVWTGIEYQVAVHLIYEGFVEEGLQLVRTVRGRHDGIRRNPWNEVECGHHYVRSMASWGLLIALSGFRCNLAEGWISFAPAVDKETFQCFWSTGRAWGIYLQQRSADGSWDAAVRVLYGNATGLKVKACGKEWVL